MGDRWRLALATLTVSLVIAAFPAHAQQKLAAKGFCENPDSRAQTLRAEQSVTRIVAVACDAVAITIDQDVVFSTSGKPEATIRIVGKLDQIASIQFGDAAPIVAKGGSCEVAPIINTGKLLVLCSVAYRQNDETLGVALAFMGSPVR